MKTTRGRKNILQLHANQIHISLGKLCYLDLFWIDSFLQIFKKNSLILLVYKFFRKPNYYSKTKTRLKDTRFKNYLILQYIDMHI